MWVKSALKSSNQPHFLGVYFGNKSQWSLTGFKKIGKLI